MFPSCCSRRVSAPIQLDASELRRRRLAHLDVLPATPAAASESSSLLLLTEPNPLIRELIGGALTLGDARTGAANATSSTDAEFARLLPPVLASLPLPTISRDLEHSRQALASLLTTTTTSQTGGSGRLSQQEDGESEESDDGEVATAPDSSSQQQLLSPLTIQRDGLRRRLHETSLHKGTVIEEERMTVPTVTTSSPPLTPTPKILSPPTKSLPIIQITSSTNSYIINNKTPTTTTNNNNKNNNLIETTAVPSLSLSSTIPTCAFCSTLRAIIPSLGRTCVCYIGNCSSNNVSSSSSNDDDDDGEGCDMMALAAKSWLEFAAPLGHKRRDALTSLDAGIDWEVARGVTPNGWPQRSIILALPPLDFCVFVYEAASALRTLTPLLTSATTPATAAAQTALCAAAVSFLSFAVKRSTSGGNEGLARDGIPSVGRLAPGLGVEVSDSKARSASNPGLSLLWGLACDSVGLTSDTAVPAPMRPCPNTPAALLTASPQLFSAVALSAAAASASAGSDDSLAFEDTICAMADLISLPFLATLRMYSFITPPSTSAAVPPFASFSVNVLTARASTLLLALTRTRGIAAALCASNRWSGNVHLVISAHDSSILSAAHRLSQYTLLGAILSASSLPPPPNASSSSLQEFLRIAGRLDPSEVVRETAALTASVRCSSAAALATAVEAVTNAARAGAGVNALCWLESILMLAAPRARELWDEMLVPPAGVSWNASLLALRLTEPITLQAVSRLSWVGRSTEGEDLINIGGNGVGNVAVVGSSPTTTTVNGGAASSANGGGAAFISQVFSLAIDALHVGVNPTLRDAATASRTATHATSNIAYHAGVAAASLATAHDERSLGSALRFCSLACAYLSHLCATRLRDDSAPLILPLRFLTAITDTVSRIASSPAAAGAWTSASELGGGNGSDGGVRATIIRGFVNILSIPDDVQDENSTNQVLRRGLSRFPHARAAVGDALVAALMAPPPPGVTSFDASATDESYTGALLEYDGADGAAAVLLDAAAAAATANGGTTDASAAAAGAATADAALAKPRLAADADPPSNSALTLANLFISATTLGEAMALPHRARLARALRASWASLKNSTSSSGDSNLLRRTQPTDEDDDESDDEADIWFAAETDWAALVNVFPQTNSILASFVAISLMHVVVETTGGAINEGMSQLEKIAIAEEGEGGSGGVTTDISRTARVRARAQFSAASALLPLFAFLAAVLPTAITDARIAPRAAAVLLNTAYALTTSNSSSRFRAVRDARSLAFSPRALLAATIDALLAPVTVAASHSRAARAWERALGGAGSRLGDLNAQRMAWNSIIQVAEREGFARGARGIALATLGTNVCQEAQRLVAESDWEMEAPSHLLDPLVFCLFRLPLRENGRGRAYDAAVIGAHLLAHAHDPFTRAPLFAMSLVPDVELAKEVREWIRSKRRMMRGDGV